MNASQRQGKAADWDFTKSGEPATTHSILAVNQREVSSTFPDKSHRFRRQAQYATKVKAARREGELQLETDADLTKRDIRILLGIALPFNRVETKLEKKLVAALEAVIERDVCPSILFRHKDLYEALLSLSRYFPRDRVAIRERGPMGKLVRNKVVVFESLVCFAKDAASCEDMIREFEHQHSIVEHPVMRETLEAQLSELRRRLEAYNDDYRKIVFTTASEIRKQQCLRMLILDKKSVNLDALVMRCRVRCQHQEG